MAAVPSLSEKTVTTTTKESQSSGDLRPAVSRHVKTLVKQVLAWQRRIHNRGQIPNRYSRYVKERKLGNRFAKVLLRRHKAVGKEPSRSLLSQSEASLVNSVPGVPLHGCRALREKPAMTSTKEIQSSGDSYPAVSPHVGTIVKEVLAWQTRKAAQRIPQENARDVEERRLALRFRKVLARRDKALFSGRYIYPQLSHSEATLVNSVRGVPLHGCSVKASCSNRGDQLETGRSKVRKKPATGSSSSRCGRKKVKNKGSTAGAKKKPAASDACSQAKRQALTDVPAKVGAMAATRKSLVQTARSSTGDGSGNGSGGLHSTAEAADVKIMLLPTPIRQQPSTPTATPLGTRSPSIGMLQCPPFPKSWNTKLEGSHSEMGFKRVKL